MSTPVLHAVLRTDLASFIAKAFATINPGTPYLSNWHIDLIAEALMACTRGEITRLMINLPPRMLKSQCVSVAWPAWVLGHQPHQRIIAASYAQSLAIKHAMDCRRVMQSDWYREMFPHTHIATDQNQKHRFNTQENGFRLATSIGGTLTGEGGNILILDDPMNPAQAMSSVQRDHVNEWVTQTFFSRLDDKEKGVIVLVMQRLHAEDVSGYLLARGGKWEHLCLPAINDAPQQWHVGGKDFVREAGQLLHPRRESATALLRAKAELGSYAYAAQYQQQPVSREGGLFKPHWFRRYRHAEGESCIHSWDTAIKTGAEHDYSVCTVWQRDASGNLYLRDVVRGKWEYPDLRRQIIALAERDQPSAIVLEDKGSGQGLLQELRQTTSLPLIGVIPRQEKRLRAATASVQIEAGKVWLPEKDSAQTPWLAAFEEECYAFPSSPHDDQVDSMVQCLLWLRERGGSARVRGL
jgi:predicted phage terminase large subunit-like protein